MAENDGVSRDVALQLAELVVSVRLEAAGLEEAARTEAMDVARKRIRVSDAGALEVFDAATVRWFDDPRELRTLADDLALAAGADTGSGSQRSGSGQYDPVAAGKAAAEAQKKRTAAANDLALR